MKTINCLNSILWFKLLQNISECVPYMIYTWWKWYLQFMFRRSYAGLNKGSQGKKKLTSHLDFGLKKLLWGWKTVQRIRVYTICMREVSLGLLPNTTWFPEHWEPEDIFLFLLWTKLKLEYRIEYRVILKTSHAILTAIRMIMAFVKPATP